MPDLISCILPTTDRHGFLAQAVRCYLRQTHEPRELIVVDDGREPAREVVPDDPTIRYLRIDEGASLGAKLNIGVRAARGRVIQKLDDDDYYHPEFLATTARTIAGRDPLTSVAALDCFLVLIAATGKVVFSGRGWSAGATLCFHRELWEKGPFREVNSAVDWWFLKDHAPRRFKVDRPELFIAVRHGCGHRWRKLKNVDVTTYFARRPEYPKALKELVPEEALAFYRSLREAS